MKKKTMMTSQAQAYARSLPERTQVQLRRARTLLETNGRLAAPLGEKVEGQDGLFAIRITHGQNVRFFYCYDDGTYIWILNGYEKKTETIPLREINKALAIKKELGL